MRVSFWKMPGAVLKVYCKRNLRETERFDRIGVTDS